MSTDYQNVTIALPGELVRQARHLAVDRGLSLSRYVAVLLQQQVDAAAGYGAARDRQRARLAKGFDLGTNGEIPWRRDELHAR